MVGSLGFFSLYWSRIHSRAQRSPSSHAVAEPVLTLLGMDFDEVIGARKQLPLF
jgi:hypothetical protein